MNQTTMILLLLVLLITPALSWHGRRGRGRGRGRGGYRGGYGNYPYKPRYPPRSGCQYRTGYYPFASFPYSSNRYCYVSRCISCPDSSSTCVECAPGYYLLAGECSSCNDWDPNCDTCDEIACLTCDTDYFFDALFVCALCPDAIDNCGHCPFPVSGLDEIVDGSFELPDILADTSEIDSVLAAPWVASATGVTHHDNIHLPLADGDQYIELSVGASVEQAVPGIFGYALVFAYSHVPGATGSIGISWDGAPLFALAVDGIGQTETNWEVAALFVLGGGPLKFEGIAGVVLLDDVSVVSVPVCDFCKDGYYLENNQCLSCKAFDNECVLCNVADVCLGCNERSFLNLSDECELCYDINNGGIECCRECTDLTIASPTTTCTNCGPGMEVQADGSCWFP